MSGLNRRPSEQPPTLVKYEKAVEIYQSILDYHKKFQNIDNSQSSSLSEGPPKKQEILNSILPPRDWTDNFDKLYIQYVSHQPASRDDVVDLQSRLNKMLEDRQARKQGVCPVRQQLYSQVYDEIIRQVAVDCSQRGLLLMRVRDQHRMTLTAYQTVYQAAVNYSMKKQIQAEERAGNLEQQYSELQKTFQELESKRDVLICQKQLLQREIREKSVAETGRRQQQLKYLKMQTDNLQKFFQIIKQELG